MREMVISTTIMTMSLPADRWSVAEAKSGLSRLVQSAQRRPQVIERRGKPVAVVIAMDQFEDRAVSARWKQFLDASARIRSEGGGDLRIPRRRPRASPFAED